MNSGSGTTASVSGRSGTATTQACPCSVSRLANAPMWFRLLLVKSP